MIVGDGGRLDDDGRLLRDDPSPPRAFRAAVRTGIISTRAGGASETGPETRITRRRVSRSLSQRVAHLSAGAVGDVAHRVERFLRGPGRDQNGLAFQVMFRDCATVATA